jgi:nucleoside-diphosphate-sugar epimerase
MSILLTGASGFVGRQITNHSFFKSKIDVVSLKQKNVSEINFLGVKSIIHLAGIAHRMVSTPDDLYYSVNKDLTLSLALKAKESGVKHFIFMSTVKVYDDNNEFIDHNTATFPNHAYGKSKLEAEKGLLGLQDEHFIVSIIRPPLILGRDVKGNLRSLMKISEKKTPLPFGKIENKRAIITLVNLNAFIIHLIKNPKSGIFLVAEDKPPSTTELITKIRFAMGMKPNLISIPSFLRNIILLIKPEFHKRLFGSLIVDNKESYLRAQFKNPYHLDDSIEDMVNAYLIRKEP